jgi:hypothetical protein
VGWCQGQEEGHEEQQQMQAQTQIHPTAFSRHPGPARLLLMARLGAAGCLRGVPRCPRLVSHPLAEG